MQVCAAQVRTDELCAAQHGSLKICAHQVRTTQVGAAQLCLAEICTDERHSTQLCLLEAGSVQVHSVQIGIAQLDAVELDGPKVFAHQLDSAELTLAALVAAQKLSSPHGSSWEVSREWATATVAAVGSVLLHAGQNAHFRFLLPCPGTAAVAAPVRIDQTLVARKANDLKMRPILPDDMGSSSHKAIRGGNTTHILIGRRVDEPPPLNGDQP